MLSDKQLRFADTYLAHGCNGRAAALAAGYAESTAAERASELIRHPVIAGMIEDQRAVIRSETDPVEVVVELADLYRSCRAAGHVAVAHQCLSSLARVRGSEAPQRMQFSNLTPEEIDLQIERYVSVIRQYEKRRPPETDLTGA
jgi:hypothetical protein